MNNEGNGTYMGMANNYVNEATRKLLGANLFPAGSIVFAKVGAAIFLERKKILSKPSCLDNNMAAFILDTSRAYTRFIHFALMNINLGSLVSTTALPSLSGSILRTITLKLPSLLEQVAIATVLSDMDAEIITLEAHHDKTRALKQGMMQELLTGRIRLFKGNL
jgi:type I restriction enzyme, S subunit